MKKFAFIGGGSFGFTRNLVRDILTFPAFRDAEIALMDINEERLDFIKRACEKIVRAGGYPAKITATYMDKTVTCDVLCDIEMGGSSGGITEDGGGSGSAGGNGHRLCGRVREA